MGQGRFGALYDRFLRKKPRQSRSRSVVEAVLLAAAELVRQGPDHDSLTIQDIADRAGVGIGSIYDYFEDKSQVFSTFAAKLTEDNLDRLQKRLERTREEPIDVAVRDLVDMLVEMYVADIHTSRMVLGVAHRIGLMPTLAESQTAFARALAAELRVREGVRVSDPEVAAYVVTNMAMGVVHAMIWAERPPFAAAELKAELSRVVIAYLGSAPTQS